MDYPCFLAVIQPAVRIPFPAHVVLTAFALTLPPLAAQVCRTDIPESASTWTVNGATATNADTGLEVARCPVGQTWSGATCAGTLTPFTWSQALQAGATAGNGWRLPNAKELESVLDRRCASPSVDTTVFPGATSDRFWSSTPGWVIDQGEGTLIGAQSAATLYAVRLVRAGFSNASYQRVTATSGAVCRSDIPGDLNVADWTPRTNVTNGDMMTDTITGLIWQRCALGQAWSGSACTGAGGAFTWSQALQAASSAGAGWRLPNAKELDAMLDRRCASPAVNPTLFPGAQSVKTWTSTPGWAVDLTDGAVLGSQNATDANSVRLVKAGNSNASFQRPIATSGAVCRTDIPGDLNVADWTTGTNVTSGDMMTDTITGLVWQRCALGQTWNGAACTGAGGTFTWSQALVAARAAGNGWRLPNAKELDAMLDRRCASPAVNPTLFPGAQSVKTWSSTPGWAVDLTDGAVLGSQNSADANSVRLVKSGLSNAGYERRIATTGAVCRADIPGDLNVANWTPGANGTITDEITGLVWARCALGQSWNATSGACTGASGTYTWAQALQEARNAGAGWRLPNAKELDAMLDRRCAAPAVNPTLFPGAQSIKTWTSTPGWAVDLTDGAVFGSQTAADANSVRLVKAGYSSASFERRIVTAGAVCRTDIPGDIDTANWTPGANGTITDTITGLVWQRCALGQTWSGTTCSGGSGTYTWAQALQAASNAGEGWRLPNAKELDAMLDRRCASPAVNPTLFPGAQNGKAWTSTPGWAVDLTDGAVFGSQNATEANSVRLVSVGYTYGAGLYVPPECAASSVATIAHVDLTATMTAANAINYGKFRQTFNVTCANGRFGVVRIPGVALGVLSGSAYALVQSTCATKPVQRMANPVATAASVNAAMAAKNNQAALLADALVGPLAAWVCQ